MTIPYTAKFPLAWPAGWRRMGCRKSAPFRVTPAQAERDLLRELQLLGARNVIVSSDRRVNRDGSFSIARQTLFDMGVAIYFTRKSKDVVLACDQYDEVHANIRAIGKTIEAMRGIERWGASDMLDRAFTGFEALPAPEQWWQVLGVSAEATLAEIGEAYRAAAKALHARGADDAEFARLNVARDAGKAARGG